MIFQTLDPTLLAALLGGAVGVVLGLTGAGGGIFAVPALVFGLGWGVPQAGPVALLAVGASAAVGSAQGLRAGLVRYRAAALMAAIGVAMAPLGTFAAHRLPEPWLVGLFAAAMIVVATRMYLGSRGGASSEIPAALPPCRLDPATGRLHWTQRVAATLGAIGAVSGFASGLLGVGGGFVIVPALRRYSDITVHGIVATSLFVIALIAAGTVANAWWHGMHPGNVGWTFVAGAIAGMIGGRRIAPHLPASRLQQLFAILMFVVALGMLDKAVGA
ncbi:membrane protein [Pandoraea terrae]|uniref:Probable membrane transporter protein n=1 Tax=Pandoraea terrae TaxID=1537710 RepID=A0A5E4ZGZ0_9BURK|nr:sulfite exporter TauE/SafE family protein [Pandoraea terrae]VVE59560.1 membrane protein [Pandoraea terrae]